MSIILKQPMIHNTFFEIIIDFILNTHRGSLKWVAMRPSAYHWHTLPRPLYVSAHGVAQQSGRLKKPFHPSESVDFLDPLAAASFFALLGPSFFALFCLAFSVPAVAAFA